MSLSLRGPAPQSGLCRSGSQEEEGVGLLTQQHTTISKPQKVRTEGACCLATWARGLALVAACEGR